MLMFYESIGSCMFTFSNNRDGIKMEILYIMILAQWYEQKRFYCHGILGDTETYLCRKDERTNSFVEYVFEVEYFFQWY